MTATNLGPTPAQTQEQARSNVVAFPTKLGRTSPPYGALRLKYAR